MRSKPLIVGVAAVVIAVIAVALVLALSGREATPSAETPEPPEPAAVLLIPGYGGDPAPLAVLDAALRDAGFDVETLDLGTGTDDLRGYAADAVAAAERLVDGGAPSVSSVGFSAGGIIGRVAADEAPDAFDEVISIASPHDGTAWALILGTACPIACQQLQPGSELLESLPEAPDEADWLSVYSSTDEIILPPDSSALPGATVGTIQGVCEGQSVRHSQVPSHPWIIDAVLAFLVAEALPTQCSSEPAQQ